MKSNLLKNLSGEYIFYKDGTEVYRSKNVITNNGKNVFVNYLSKTDTQYASKIVLGTGGATAVATNEFLNFEIYPVAVLYRTSDFTQTPAQIVFKSTLPTGFNGVIYEAGLTTLGGIIAVDTINDNSELAATFDPDFESWSTNANVVFHSNDLEGTPRLRVGDSGLQITAASSTSVSSTLSGVVGVDYIADGDKLKFAFHVSGSIPSSIDVKFENSDGDYLTATIPSASITTGYNIVTVDFDDLTASGSMDMDSTSLITVTVNAAASQTVVTMDGIRFDKYSDISKPVLISHSILSTPLVVEGGTQFDIEYRLGFDI